MNPDNFKYTNAVDDTLELSIFEATSFNVLVVALYDDAADRESEIVLPAEKARLLRDWLLEHYPLDAISRMRLSRKDEEFSIFSRYNEE